MDAAADYLEQLAHGRQPRDAVLPVGSFLVV